MNAKEVYIWYCKYKKVLPIIKCMFYEIKPRMWDFSIMNYRETTFDEYFKYKLNISGPKYIFNDMFPYHQIHTHKYGKTKKYINAKKGWKYFFENNVKILSKIDIGDKVEVEFLGTGGITKGTVYSNDKLSEGIISIKSDTTFEMILECHTSSIVTLNEKPFELQYYIEMRGKKYGIQ